MESNQSRILPFEQGAAYTLDSLITAPLVASGRAIERIAIYYKKSLLSHFALSAQNSYYYFHSILSNYYSIKLYTDFTSGTKVRFFAY